MTAASARKLDNWDDLPRKMDMIEEGLLDADEEVAGAEEGAEEEAMGRD